MILTALLIMLAAPADAPPDPPRQLHAQVIFREQIMIRVPARRPKSAPSAAPVTGWKEGKGPKCVAARSIAGATMISQNSVDLLLKNGGRLRARLERSCPALDYYYGFYIRPNRDAQICADRDAIRSRVGGQCEIDAFRQLTPRRRKP